MCVHTWVYVHAQIILWTHDVAIDAYNSICHNALIIWCHPQVTTHKMITNLQEKWKQQPRCVNCAKRNLRKKMKRGGMRDEAADGYQWRTTTEAAGYDQCVREWWERTTYSRVVTYCLMRLSTLCCSWTSANCCSNSVFCLFNCFTLLFSWSFRYVNCNSKLCIIQSLTEGLCFLYR